MRVFIGLIALSVVVAACSHAGSPAASADTLPTVNDDSVRQAINMAEFLDRHKPMDLPQHDSTGEHEFALMAGEDIGGISIGMGSAAVEELLGTAEMRGEIENWGADGCDHQDWQWPRKGISLNMEHCREKEPWRVFMMSVQEGCELATARGIRLGSTHEEVMAAYGEEVEEGFASPSGILAGSIYGGLSFGLEEGKVTSISLGAFAE